jgi:hypothetical protein
MTTYSDDSDMGSRGRARKRVEDLIRDAREVRYTAEGWMIRAPMDVLWQRWRRWGQDPKWAELLAQDVPEPAPEKDR